MSSTDQVNPNKCLSNVAQARSAVCLGLSLTAIMGAVLFFLVYVNPKDESYGFTPLIYSGCCILFAAVMNRLAVRFEAGS
ncbi:MAG: hypothetical protein AAF664_02340 [Planctomycetota bacterium]